MKCIFALILLVASTSSAYFVAVPAGQAPLRYDQPVRILFSGLGDNLGHQPQMSALSKARLFLRSFPQGQVVLISIFENPQNEQKLANGGWTFLEKNAVPFATDSAMKELLKFQNIS
ncbi:MAG: hypothetical protein EOP09_11445, partial [Proteobacteria bacterium]